MKVEMHLLEIEEMHQRAEKELKRANFKAKLYLAFCVLVFGTGVVLSIIRQDWMDMVDFIIFLLWGGIFFVLMMTINYQNHRIAVLRGGRDIAVKQIDDLLDVMKKAKEETK